MGVVLERRQNWPQMYFGRGTDNNAVGLLVLQHMTN